MIASVPRSNARMELLATVATVAVAILIADAEKSTRDVTRRVSSSTGNVPLGAQCAFDNDCQSHLMLCSSGRCTCTADAMLLDGVCLKSALFRTCVQNYALTRMECSNSCRNRAKLLALLNKCTVYGDVARLDLQQRAVWVSRRLSPDTDA